MFGRGFPSAFDNDPFFRDPFGAMDNMMRSMFNDPFFSQPLMPPHMLPGFGFPPGLGPHGQAHANAPLPPPVVEEVDEGQDHASTSTTNNHNEPMVEEPDDQPPAPAARGPARPAQPQQQPQPQPAAVPHAMFPAFGGFGGIGGNPGGFYSYSSSSYSSVGGPQGVTYSSTTTTRSGPGQVRESQTTVRDGRTGQHTITISRGLGNKSRTITRTKDATGREVTEDHLEGPDTLDTTTFDHQWSQEAERNLPTWGTRQPTLRLGPQQRGPAAQPQLALPYPGHHGSYPAPDSGNGRPGQRYG